MQSIYRTNAGQIHKKVEKRRKMRHNALKQVLKLWKLLKEYVIIKKIDTGEEDVHMNTRKGLNLFTTLLLIGLVPMIVIAIVLSIISVQRIGSITKNETKDRLKVAAYNLGNYYREDMAQGTKMDDSHDYVDSLLEDDIVLTLFKEDTRYITSIKGEDGKRNEGTKADADIYKQVCEGKDYYSEDVTIGDKEYYVYYAPIEGAGGKVVGMAFAGETVDNVRMQIRQASVWFVVIAIVSVVIFSVIVILLAIKIRKPIIDIVGVVDEIAAGNLDKEVNSSSKIAEIQTLVQATHKLQLSMSRVISGVMSDVGNLDQNMGNITDKVHSSNQAAEAIATAVDELAKGTIDMAESVQNTASQMADIGNHISEINQLATDAAQASNIVKQESNDAKNQLAQLIQANVDTIQISGDVVTGIHESSEAIENIRQAADVIAQIASQTSLLALNASIEAARAGEYGRGFSVVAGEISNLATQSDESTQEIQKVVAEIIHASEQNVLLANKIKTAVDNEKDVLAKVRNSFDVVDDKAVQSADAIMKITDKTERLNLAKEKVLDEITTLSAISEEDAAGCQETNSNMEEFAANMEEINQQAVNTQDTSRQLRESVSYFQI